MAVNFLQARYYAARFYKSRRRKKPVSIITGGHSNKKLNFHPTPAAWEPYVPPVIDLVKLAKKRRKQESDFFVIAM
jgi:hypothetical protein